MLIVNFFYLDQSRSWLNSVQHTVGCQEHHHAWRERRRRFLWTGHRTTWI